MKTTLKKFISFITVFACVFALVGIHSHEVHVHALGSLTADDNATLVTEEKVYSKATLDDDFADDRVIIVMTHEASMGFKTYSASDFAEVNVKSVEDLTTASANMVKAKVNKTDIVMRDGTTIKSDNKVKVDTYNQIITLELNETGKDKVLAAIKELEKREDILYVGPDFFMHQTSIEPNDPYDNYQNLWAMQKLQLPEAWEINTGSSSVIVGIIDSGIMSNHPDLAGRVNNSLGRDYTGNNNVDDDGHGTRVAGIIGAVPNNYIGLSGVCWNVTLVSLKVSVNGLAPLSNIISAINYANSISIPILNFSMGGEEPTTDPEIALKNAIENYTGLFVCAAGNEHYDLDNEATYNPAAYILPNLITVGNCESDDSPAPTTNYGQTTVDLFAPGEQIDSTNYNGDYNKQSGTSFSAPYVTGVAALILSENSTLQPEQIKTAILNNVDEIEDLETKCVSGGRLNALKALEFVEAIDQHVHNYEIFLDNGSIYTHSVICTICGHTFEDAHYWRYRRVSGSLVSHNVICSNCGAVTIEGHTWVERINDRICTVCGQIDDSGFIPVIRPSGINKEDDEE